jgi:D-sedoheptulose 7-phosphate isomerase
MVKKNLIFNKKINEIINNFLKLKSSKNLLQIENAEKLLLTALNKKKKIIFCGNGGSAADSQHLAAELVGQYLKKNRKAIPAISLTTNTSTITSVANDLNYDLIFSRQLEAIGTQGDTLFCISTSGKSKNILKVLQKANNMKIKTILLTGEKFIKNKNINIQINVPSSKVDRIQEMHIFVGHFLCELIEKKFS